MLGSQEVDLAFLIFFSHFYFLFDLFFFILFLELGLGLEWQDHAVAIAGHIKMTWSQDIWHMEGMMCMLPLGNIHDHLG